MNNQQRNKIIFGFAYVLTGALVLGYAAFTEPFPSLLDWLPFAAVVVVLEWRSIEMNDHLSASPTVMVLLAAAVAFGPESAALGVGSIAAVSLFSARDFSQRRVLVPLLNWGQAVTAATLSGLVLEGFLPTGSVYSSRILTTVAVGSMIASGLYHVLNLGLVNLAVSHLYQRRDLRPWSRMGEIVPSAVLMGVVGALLGMAYNLEPVVLPLMFGLFGVGYLAFASHGELREAQEAALRGFVKALEAKDLYTRGHTERVAYFAQLIGEELNYRGTRLERLRWAALIHDVGKLAVPRELIRKRGRLEEVEYEQLQHHAHVVENLLAEVGFLRPMVEIASGHHSRYDGTGYGGTGHAQGVAPPQEACILAVADAFDAMTSSRSYRMALSQSYAFAELRRHAGTQFDPIAVEALIAALAKTGERYGSPNLASEDEARSLAEGRLHQHG